MPVSENVSSIKHICNDKKATSQNQYYIYILTNKNNTILYTGVTNNLMRRVLEHRSGSGSKFTSKYKAKKLVYFETTDDINAVIVRENRSKPVRVKRKLISSKS